MPGDLSGKVQDLMASASQQRLERLRQFTSYPRNEKVQEVKPLTRVPWSMKPQENKLKYVKLLDPTTRANRWMYTTWHHLPEYKNNNPVINWSSHFVRTHSFSHGYYILHPDWG